MPPSSSRDASIMSASASAIASSFWWSASSERLWLFWRSATIRNVTMVVAVLITSCHVSMLPNSG
jgi:hypothetical protein